MSALAISSIAFACIFGGALLGMALRVIVPQHHLSEDSKDVVKLGAGMIATLAALVLGLLIASAKGTFDTMSNEIRQSGTKIILLNRAMAQYGPETRDARDLLRRVVVSVLERGWPEETSGPRTVKPVRQGTGLEGVQDAVRGLSPKTDDQTWLKSRALQLSCDAIEARWLLMEHRGQSSLPAAFLVILVLWLTIIFASFGLLSPRNGTVIAVLLICSLSVAGSIFLIEELDRPIAGLIKISSAPLHGALASMGQ